MKQLCSGNLLESLELSDVGYGPWSPRFVEAMDFLFPTPNKETGIHHFSRLESLKLDSFGVDEWPDDDDDEVDEDVRARLNLFDDKKRIKMAFPKLRALILGNVLDNYGILKVKGSQLESLHLCRVSNIKKEKLPSFDCLSELCLCGDSSKDCVDLFYEKKEENPNYLSKIGTN